MLNKVSNPFKFLSVAATFLAVTSGTASALSLADTGYKTRVYETWTCGSAYSTGNCALADFDHNCTLNAIDIALVVDVFKGIRPATTQYNVSSVCESNLGNLRITPISSAVEIDFADIDVTVNCVKAFGGAVPNCAVALPLPGTTDPKEDAELAEVSAPTDDLQFIALDESEVSAQTKLEAIKKDICPLRLKKSGKKGNRAELAVKDIQAELDCRAWIELKN